MAMRDFNVAFDIFNEASEHNQRAKIALVLPFFFLYEVTADHHIREFYRNCGIKPNMPLKLFRMTVLRATLIFLIKKMTSSPSSEAR